MTDETSDPPQNITGHLRYTLRLLDAEVERRRTGQGSFLDAEELTQVRRLVASEQVRQRSGSAAGPYQHPLADVISTWPPEHPLTLAMRAIVDHAWRRIEFSPDGGIFSFPRPI